MTRLVHAASAPPHPWWRDAVVYQVYPRSFADSDGDGVGDLPGLTARLGHLRELGVDAVWVGPFFRSPQVDGGYDVSDYRDVDPVFGTLANTDALIERAHALGLRILVDVVPNHSSDAHPWFQQALHSQPGSPQRDRYLFRSGRGPTGDEPPNNWLSVFGGPAWTQVEPGDPTTGTLGQWYLHLFDSRQPDFNWHNPQVRAEFEDVLRFWLDRGVDGFRVDVAHSLIKQDGLPDWEAPNALLRPGDADYVGRPQAPMWDRDEVHEIYRTWRAIIDAHPATWLPSTETDGHNAGHDGDDTALPAPALTEDRERILCAEAWVDPIERAARYVRPDEMHQSFNFHLLQTPWRARDLRKDIENSLRAMGRVGAPTTWVLSNHDVIRHATRLGFPPSRHRPNGIGPNDPQPDAVLGLRRARAATTLLLALPGSAYLYQGEELGLPDHTTLPDEYRTDPAWKRTGGKEPGRDGCRVPLPWHSERPALGFSPTGATWLPQPDTYRALALNRQRDVPDSTWQLYRHLLRLRRHYRLGAGSLAWLKDVPEDTLVFVNEAPGRASIAVVCHLGPQTIPMPVPGTVVATSATSATGSDWSTRLSAATIAPDTTMWLLLP